MRHQALATQGYLSIKRHFVKTSEKCIQSLDNSLRREKQSGDFGKSTPEAKSRIQCIIIPINPGYVAHCAKRLFPARINKQSEEDVEEVPLASPVSLPPF
jgi:hypothetical protein